MDFGIISLGDHARDPNTGKYNESQAQRHQMLVEMGVRGEEAGFESILLGEHHFNEYIVAAPQMVLAAIASRTNRIRLGTAVTLLPNNDPVRLGEEFATLDLLSNGRAEIGFGGGLTPETSRLLGQDPEVAKEKGVEHLELLLRLWDEKEVSWRGEHRPPFDNGTLQPRTYSGSAIPVNLATASSVATVEAAARAGHKIMLMTNYKRYVEFHGLADRYRDLYRQSGHDPAGMCVSTIAYVHMRSDDRNPWQSWEPYLLNYQKLVGQIIGKTGITNTLKEQTKGAQILDFDYDCFIHGNGDEVTQQVRAIDEAIGGIDRLMCYFDAGGLSQTDTLNAITEFGGSVIPTINRDAG